MAKNVLFLLHGVGQHGEDWATKGDGPIATLIRESRRYSLFKEKKLEDLVEFVPIRYDDIFDRVLAGWSDLAAGLAGAGPVGADAVERVTSLFERAGKDREKLLAYGGDVPLYKGFRLFAQRVQIRVIAKMASVIAARSARAGGTPVRYNVLAHSLGTAVAHDALHHLGTEEWLEGDFGFKEDRPAASRELETYAKAVARLVDVSGNSNPFAPEVFRFDTVFMLSNTSQLLHTTKEDAYASIVRPNTPGHPGSCCQSYYNVDHKLDPISKVGRFELPDTWRLMGGKDISGLDHYYGFNIHAYSHYLRHPKVHLPLLIHLVNGYEPSEADRILFQTFPARDLGFWDEQAERLVATLQPMAARALAPAQAAVAEWLDVYRSFMELLPDA